MSTDRALELALRQAGIPGSITDRRDLSGGCIHQVMELVVDSGARVVAKFAHAGQRALLEEEAAGLKALAETATVLVPQPLAAVSHGGVAVLLMTAIERHPPSEPGWQRLGEDLASLHNADVGERYGFDIDNHLGTTPQPNGWCQSWVEFNREHRLGHQLHLAEQARVLHREEARRIHAVIERLDALIPDRPKPAPLHGDLWSGNALPTIDQVGKARVAVIDPVPYIGDGWADIAMMQLFGGFSHGCFATYTAAISDHEHVDERLAVYQLYHLLNHVNLFGRGYVGQVMAVANRLV